MSEPMTLESHGKWLRKAAAEIAANGYYGWGNTCLQAAEAIDALLSAEPAEPVKVDVEAVREVIEVLRCDEMLDLHENSPESISRRLAAAIGDTEHE